MSSSTVVIVGSGQAGLQVAVSLRQEGFDGRVVLVGDEPGLPYQRPPLSKAYMTGDADEARLRLRPQAFFTDHTVELLAPERVTAIHRAGRSVALASGRHLAYDHLVLALGARHRPLPVPGADLDGVRYLRTLPHARALRERLADARHVVIVGAGFIGLEFAAVAAAKGVGVVVLEASGRVMGRSVSTVMSEFFTGQHRRQGSVVELGASVARLIGEGGRVVAAETTAGRGVPADLVLVGIGVVPDVELAEAAGLAVSNGIVVDESLGTGDPAISAVGDCAAFPTRFAVGPVRLESVQNAVDHGRCVAARLAGRPFGYDSVPWFWSDQGKLKLQIAGITTGHETTVVRGDPDAGRFSVFCFHRDRLLGVESVNRPGDHMAARRLLVGEAGLTPEQAADESFDLKKLAATIAPPTRAS